MAEEEHVVARAAGGVSGEPWAPSAAFPWTASAGGVGLGALVVVLAAIAPPTFDEWTYYVPALEALRSEPRPALSEIPFPGPPVALWIQGVVWDALGRTTFALRAFGVVAWVGLACLPLLRRVREGPMGDAYGYALTVAFPFVLYASVSSKHHGFVLALLVLAIACHRRAARGDRTAVWVSAVACALAAGSSQFAGPLCLALAIDAVRERHGPTATMGRLVGPCLGLGVLAAFVLFWGGPAPRSFVDVAAFEREATTGTGFRWRPEQLLVGLATLGLWGVGWTGVSRRGGAAAAAFLVPCVLLAWSSGVLDEGTPLHRSGRGPLCSVLRLPPEAPGVPLPEAALGAIAAVGAGVVVARARADADGRLGALYVAVYLAATMAVPYPFESYFLMLVVPYCHLVGRPASSPSRWRALRWWVPAAGVAYVVAKSLRLVTRP